MIGRDRITSSLIMIGATVFAIFNPIALLVVVMGLTIGGLYEFFYLIKKKDIPIYSYTGIAIGALIPFTTYLRFSPTKGWELIFIVLALLLVFLLQIGRNENENAIVGISTTLFGVLYVSWFFSFLIKVRYLLPGLEGAKLLGFLLLVVKGGDIGALVIGKRFGKHPLMPKTSPNKTIEGSIGSCLTSVIIALVLSSWLPDELNFTFWQIILIGAVFGVLGQVGDLSESMIKRDCNVKDSGKALPALGGVLDMIDSLLFAAPAFYFYMSVSLNI